MAVPNRSETTKLLQRKRRSIIKLLGRGPVAISITIHQFNYRREEINALRFLLIQRVGNRRFFFFHQAAGGAQRKRKKQVELIGIHFYFVAT